ncbi:prepilin-type cleavage/methylation domain-containing protein [Sesbania bispinosa]|nr:prepilin-type cleavage/methylation domain-containing protein [Sesbania bispinosa]
MSDPRENQERNAREALSRDVTDLLAALQVSKVVSNQETLPPNKTVVDPTPPVIVRPIC